MVFVGDESDSGTTEEMSDFYHVTESFQAAISMGPCVLVVDGIDELTDSCGLTAQQVGANIINLQHLTGTPPSHPLSPPKFLNF